MQSQNVCETRFNILSYMIVKTHCSLFQFVKLSLQVVNDINVSELGICNFLLENTICNVYIIVKTKSVYCRQKNSILIFYLYNTIQNGYEKQFVKKSVVLMFGTVDFEFLVKNSIYNEYIIVKTVSVYSRRLNSVRYSTRLNVVTFDIIFVYKTIKNGCEKRFGIDQYLLINDIFSCISLLISVNLHRCVVFLDFCFF